MTVHRRALTCSALILLLVLTASAAVAQQSDVLSNFRDPARAFFASPEYQDLLKTPIEVLEKSLDTVHTLEYDVPIGGGHTMHLTEIFTLRSWLRRPHRAVLFLHGPKSNGKFWTLPSRVYNGPEQAALRGMFAFTVDLIGVGESYHPEKGSEVTWIDSIEPTRIIVRYIRQFRQVKKVDLVGESVGGWVGVELAQDPRKIRTLVLSSMLYEELIATQFVTPQFRAFLDSQPNGYLPVSGNDFLGELSYITDEAVRQYVFDTQPGIVPTGNLYILFDGPPYGDPSLTFGDPREARAPGLVIGTSNDTVASPEDPFRLAEDYGVDGAEVVIFENGSHVPRLAEPDKAAAYWQIVFDFIDP